MEQIMNQTDVKVSFYLKKSEADARGNCPVMARLIVGKHSETAFSVKFRVPQSLWSSGRACGKSVAARDINNRLDEIRAAALGIYAEQSAIREDVTAEDVKHQLLGMASEQETLLSYFRLFIRNFEKRVGINRTEKTLRAYRNSYNHLVRFLQMQYKLSDIPFAALDRSFIEKYDLYLRTECCLADWSAELEGYLSNLLKYKTEIDKFILKDYEDGGTTNEYVRWHLDEWEAIDDLLPNADSTKTKEEQFLSLLIQRVETITFYPGDNHYAVWDYMIDSENSDEIVVVHTDNKGKILDITCES